MTTDVGSTGAAELKRLFGLTDDIVETIRAVSIDIRNAEMVVPAGNYISREMKSALAKCPPSPKGANMPSVVVTGSLVGDVTLKFILRGDSTVLSTKLARVLEDNLGPAWTSKSEGPTQVSAKTAGRMVIGQNRASILEY